MPYTDNGSANECASESSSSKSDDLIQAVLLADKIRREHNGVFVVNIYLGHDGDHSCELRNYDERVGYGSSGRSLLEAVQLANADRAFRKLLKKDDFITEIAQSACDHQGMFTILNFQNQCHPVIGAWLSEAHVIKLLENTPRIIRIAEGRDYYVLPEGVLRFMDTESEVVNILWPNFVSRRPDSPEDAASQAANRITELGDSLERVMAAKCQTSPR